MPRAQSRPCPAPPRPPPLGRYAAVELGCVGAARRRTGPFAPAALEAGALCDVAETFGWELDTRPKNPLPVALPPKLNLQPLELRLASLLPPLLLSGSATPAFSIARRSSSFQASERRPSSARAAFCAALTSWLRLGCVSSTCPAADGPAAAAAAPSASSCAGRSTASGVAITRTNLLARGCGAQPVTWGGAKRVSALFSAGSGEGARGAAPGSGGLGQSSCALGQWPRSCPRAKKFERARSTLRCASGAGQPVLVLEKKRRAAPPI